MAANSFYNSGKIPGQAQIRRDDSTDQGQATNLIQETGTQVKNMAQGAAQGAVNVAHGAANMAQNTAEAVKNTLGMNDPSTATTGTAAGGNITESGSKI
ncbi:uncharacterized protein LOC132066573 [Lycium ferocissimum]|uniref:uncharacterized protein LOC132066573 n=1 Tax=Lycium ferocissimum TaxID=112874 RepID=UPI002816463B|nr:uncharacterized protein LOC132066573 [Lycium ferocissimum]